jgi:methanogenic corrinoid protein MtbC1
MADEHLATEISLSIISLQREAARTVSHQPEYRVLCATPAGERHDVALRMSANLLNEAGYEVVMLGADVPLEELAVCAARIEPDVVCLSATMGAGRGTLVTALDAIGRRCPHAAYVLGGHGVGAYLRARPDVTVCASVSGVAAAVDGLVKRRALS